MNKFLILIMGLILMVGATGYTYQITAPPSTFTTQSSTSVNVSGNVNVTYYGILNGSNPNLKIEVMIMNRSCSTCSYDNHSNYIINGSEGAFWNQTITLGSGYNWIYLNFTNATAIGGVASHVTTSANVINIDPDMYKLNIGGSDKINITLDTGNLATAGTVTSAGYLTGANTGGTYQLNATGCNLTVSGGIITGYAGCAVS